MSANLPQSPAIENVSSTLSSGITDVATSVDISAATNFTSPGYYVIDRVDAAGAVKSTSLWEYIKVTNIASNTLTATRGVNGSTNQAHSAGAVIEAVVTSAHFEDWYAALNPEHTASGGHVITGTMTVAGMNLASVATIARANIGVFQAHTHISASGASITGFGGVGGFNALFQVPGGLASVANIGGLIPIPVAYTSLFINAFVQTPASIASIGVHILKNSAVVGVCEILGGATFASTASLSNTVLSAGDVLTMDIRSTASLAQNLSVLIRAT